MDFIDQARAYVENDADGMYQILQAMAEEYGINLQDLLDSIWDENLTPLENYKKAFAELMEMIQGGYSTNVNINQPTMAEDLKSEIEKATQEYQEIKKQKKAETDPTKKAALKAEKQAKKREIEALQAQYDQLMSGTTVTAQKDIQAVKDTFEETSNSIGATAANMLRNLMLNNAQYKDDAHAVYQKNDADWDKSKQYQLASLIKMLDSSVDNYDQALNIVQGDSNTIAASILSIAQQHGLDIESVITASWNSSLSALENYKAALATVTSMAAAAQQSTSSVTGSGSSTVTSNLKSDLQDRLAELETKKRQLKDQKKTLSGDARAKVQAELQQTRKEIDSINEELEKLPSYATGLRKSKKDHWAITNEAGSEAIVTKNGILTPISRGSSVLTADQTANLYDLAKIDANKILEGLMKQNTTAVTNSYVSPTLNSEVNITIAGSVTDSNLNKIQDMIDQSIKNSYRQLNYGIRR